MLIQNKLTKTGNKRGFTLVELMIVVAIIGVLAALAIYGVRKYLTNAKSAEARTAIGRISKDATVAYEKETMAAGVMGLTSLAAIAHRLCDDSTMVPATPPAAEKYQSTPNDWTGPPLANGDETLATGWSCLKFSMDSPQYYSYQYTLDGSAITSVVGNNFTVLAVGDLDGDGDTSSLSMVGEIQADADGNEILTLAPTITEVNVEE